MINEQEYLGPELIAAVRMAVEATTGVEFSVLLATYLKNNDQPNVSAADFVSKILEAGRYQTEDITALEDMVHNGVTALFEEFDLIEVLHLLSNDARLLALTIARGCGTAQARWLLDGVSQDDENGFDLEKGMKELLSFGLIQVVTLIEERREQLARMPKPRDISQTDERGLSEPYTSAEYAYFNLEQSIKAYDNNRETQPATYASWDEPRYRLRPDFQKFIDDANSEEE